MRYQAEVIVIGGGPGGISAAISAAREKRNTVLITDRPVLGGNSSSEIRVWARGATGAGSFFAEEMGIWGELKLKNLYTNPEGNPVFWDDVLLDAVLSEEYLTLFLNTHVTAVDQTEDRVAGVTAFQMGAERQLEFTGDWFIDATGDGSIGAMCGIPFRIGKEDHSEYEEPYAPLRSDQATMGSSFIYFTGNSGHPVAYKAPDYAYSIDRIEEILNKGGRIVNETMDGCDYWWFETGGAGDTIGDAQAIAMELKRLVAGVWNYIKNSGKFASDHLTLLWQGNLPGKRESRRMITERVVRQQDVESRICFEDAAFYGGWYLDFHPSDGFAAEEDNCIQIPVQVYAMPFRCLYNRRKKNLLFAGRNIGASHVAFASSRIMNTCAMSGQAAGLLAASCLVRNKSPWELGSEDIRDMQRSLNRNDMLLPGIRLQDESNLALTAAVGVSSAEQYGTADDSASISLKADDFLVVPSLAGAVEVLLDAPGEAELCYDCYAFDLPSKLALTERRLEAEISVVPGRHWHSLILPESDHEQFYLLLFKKTDGIRIRTGERQLTGFLGGSKAEAGLWYPCVRFGNPDLYGGKQLVNGYNRPWQAPNLWISKAETQPYVTYQWEQIQQIRRIDLYFNPDLSLELNSARASRWNKHHMFEARTQMPPQLVKDFEVCAWQNDRWSRVCTVRDNWQRKRTIHLNEPLETKGLMIRIISTYGAEHGELFEVGIYQED